VRPRIQRSRRRGWRIPPNTVCVSRPSRFRNYVSRPAARTVEARAKTGEEYRAWLKAPEQAEHREQVRRKLRGRNLACWCPPDLPCHADVLLETAHG
jgi:hypothetical protein